LNDPEAGNLTEMTIFFKHLDSLKQNGISFCLEKRNGNIKTILERFRAMHHNSTHLVAAQISISKFSKKLCTGRTNKMGKNNFGRESGRESGRYREREKRRGVGQRRMSIAFNCQL
jgi:hypothetical protein